MNDSTKRTLRTIIQGIIALASGIPIVVAALPGGVDSVQGVATLIVWLGIITRVINALEDANIIPASWTREAKS